MTDLTAKARRAACWLPTAFEKLDAGLYADTWTVFQLEDEVKGLWGYLHCDLSDRMMIAFCEDRGWQDQEPEPCSMQNLLNPHKGQGDHGPELVIPTEEEALALCAIGMAQLMDEIDPDPIQLDDGSRYGNSHIEADGVEWNMKTEAASYGELVLVVERFEDRWEWKVQEIFGDVLYPASGTAPTREEARRQAVEAARGMG